MEHKQKYLIPRFLLIFVLCLVNPVRSDLHQPNSCKHFVLVHGAAHGAWSWYKLVPLLRSSGHNVTTFDLAASGINPKQVLDVPLISEFFKPIIEFFTSLPPHEKVILVGHSYSGLGISLAMEKFPDRISTAVFVVALMPGPRTNFSIFLQEATKTQGDVMDSYVTYDNGLNNSPTTNVLGPKYLAKKVYQLSPIQDLTLALSLVRPFYVYSVEDLSRTIKLSDKNYGSVSRVFIEAHEDIVLQKNFQQWMIKENPPKEVKIVKRSDHMVMLCQTKKLYVQLLDIAQKYS